MEHRSTKLYIVILPLVFLFSPSARLRKAAWCSIRRVAQSPRVIRLIRLSYPELSLTRLAR